MKKIEKYNKLIHNFFSFFFISLIIISTSIFLLIGNFNLLRIIFLSLLLSIFYLSYLVLKEKFEEIFPVKLFYIATIVIILIYLFSSFENLKILDEILGIQNFTQKILAGNIYAKNLILEPLIYERYKTAEETFSEKLKEFNNSISYLELKLHEEVNKLRASLGLTILKFDDRLREIARYHSKDMALRDYFDHISPDGETLKDRFQKFNYDCKIFVDNYVYEGAENLFLGRIYKSFTYEKISKKIISYDFYSFDEFAKEVVNSWYKSEGHRKNMLFEYWKNEGIGIFIDEEGKVYVTQVFC